MIYSDYCFISQNGKVLAEETLSAEKVGGFAQKLARRHQTTIHIWIAAGELVEPDKCPTCGEILPEIGPCWHDLFPEEEGITDSISFRGEAYPARIVTEQDEYF